LEESGLLEKKRIREKPLHIEYKLSTRGRALIQVFEVLEEGIKK
jgi:DNA-binding HxlR family transcriptional regulator